MVRPAGHQATSQEPPFTSVRRTRLFEGVVAQLRTLIKEGRLQPGQRLLPERELAERFQVSRASLREAIRALERDGLVVIRPGAGTFVSEEGFDAAVEALAQRLLEERQALADITELRLILEPQIAALAAQRATREDRNHLLAMLKEQQRQIAAGETGAAADTAFHSAVAAASHNQALERLSAILVDLLAPIRDEGLQTPDRSLRSLATHRAILEAVQRGDTEASRQAMQEHILGVQQGLAQGSEEAVQHR
ncbi:MAG: FadR family transcriptional regulator [Chloroflexi bacterium]|nr:FadR family transcriptional regulator [Chloroflexota bacterium]MBI4198127.1 FadR family transcriptional regulator [Chloroflexota bacterium]